LSEIDGRNKRALLSQVRVSVFFKDCFSVSKL
jgi:hypothetical protein